MKKHPVDDLFKSKLAGLEKRPSGAAWGKLVGEQKSHSRKMGIWVWYAAAGILVAFMGGYLAWQNAQQVSVGKQVAIISEPKRVVIDTPTVDAKPFGSIVKIVKEPIQQQLPINESLRPNISVKNAIDVHNANVVKSQGSEIDTEIQKNNYSKVEQIASLSANEKKVNIPEAIEPILTIVENQVNKESLVAAKEVKEENRIIVVNVEMPDDESGEKGKNSRFSKVFRQLKNVRAGDPVDWKEVGFNPKDVLAKVDGRGRNRDEENVEKSQGTKRTKL